MPGMRLNYSAPQDEAPFEDLCLKLLRVHWNCPALELYARRGEKQFGIDIIDQGGSPLRAAQCKLHEAWKSLLPNEIEIEVSKAREFTPPLSFYAILTTAKVSAKSQNKIISINNEHNEKGLFQVHLYAWDQIKSWLDNYPQVADEFYPSKRNPSSEPILKHLTEIKFSVASIAADKNADSIDNEIDEAKHHLEQREFQVARPILNRLRDKKWDQLSSRQKFRLLSNIGTSHLGENEEQMAAKNFLEAKQWQPDDERACANETLAYQLLNDSDRAFDLASTYRRKFPNSTRFAALWIQNAPTNSFYSKLKKEIPKALHKDPEVSVALAHRAHQEKDNENAVKWAKQAIKSKPDWPYPRLMLAQILLERYISETLDTFGQMLIPNEDIRLREAETACSKAIALAESEKNKNLHAEALLTRGLAIEILGNKKQSEEDIQYAYRIAPFNHRVIRDYAILLLKKGNRSEAIRLLEEIMATSDEDSVSVLLADALAERNAPGDKDKAIKLYVKIVKSPAPIKPGSREEFIDRAVRVMGSSNKWEEIRLLLDEIPKGSISKICDLTYKSYLFFRQGKQKEAFDFATEALKAVSGNTSRHDKRRLARLLSECGRWKDALPLWEKLATTTKDSADVKSLLKCAERLGRHDIILSTCKSLREAGVWDSNLLDLEISLLEGYDVESAINLLQQHLKNKPDDQLMRLRLSVIGQRLERPDLVTSNSKNIPPVEETTPYIGRVIVQVLRRAGKPDDALRYAYELLRRNYFDVEAHKAYISTMHIFGPKPTIIPPEKVEPGTAVRFTEKGSNFTQWVIVEDSTNPDESRNEIPPDHHIAKKLLEKRKGDEFIIAEGEVYNRTGVINDILSKYVYCYQRCMEEWQLKFPETPGIETVRLTKTDESATEPPLDISPILKSIDRRHEQIDTLKDIYRKTTTPVHIFGEAFRKGAFEAMIFLAESDDIVVRSCLGTSEEIDSAQKAISESSTIVIELTGLATLAMLECVKLLPKFFQKIIISQSTRNELYQLVHMDSMIPGSSGTLSKVEGKYTFFEETQDEKKKRIDRLKELSELILANCQVMSCKALASIDPEKREILIKGIGQHGAESVILASMPGHVLWTDDHTLARLALGEFGVRRIWTQTALQALAEQGSIKTEEFFKASAKLLGWRYSFTSPSAPTLMKAAELADWKPDQWPLKNSLEIFKEEAITLENTLQLAASFLVALYKETLLPETQQAILIRCLEVLARRKHGMEGIRTLTKVLPELFGLNVVRGEEAMKVIRYWLKHAKKTHITI